MPRHDPLTPRASRGPDHGLSRLTEFETLAQLRAQLADAERTADAAVRERAALRRQLHQPGVRLRDCNWIDAAAVRAALEGPSSWVLWAILKNGGGRPPAAGLAVPAVPPRGPLPLEGGAEAPLEFGD